MSLDNDELFSIFNDINFTMITNNLVMKDKIFDAIPDDQKFEELNLENLNL